MSGSVSTTPITFGYTGASVQATVQTAGTYYIAAFGAQGGASAYVTGGGGGEIGGEFTLAANEALTIAVGGQGGSSSVGDGGGGGGSFVVGPSNTPLVIAGGGGGADFYGGSDPGQTGTSGSTPAYGGVGGTNGAGGAGANSFHGGGGGGGFTSSGGSNTGAGGAGGGGGYPGLAGGAAANNDQELVAAGGFGGGGGSDHFGAGGGGGYSGGGGGDYATQYSGGGGGGGGSYDASSSHTLLVAGENGGNGSVFIAPVDTPTIGGTIANQPAVSAATIDPFSGIAISDSNLGSLPETVMVTPGAAGTGTLSDPHAATDGSSISNGVYTVAGTAAQVQADLRGLMFTAAMNQSSQAVTTGFTVSVTNVAGQAATDSTTSVVTPSAAQPSTITVPASDQTQTATGLAAVTPFAGAKIADPNPGGTETVTVTPSSTTAGTLSDPNAPGDGSTVNSSNGAITLTGTAGAVTTELDALTFAPASSQFGKTTSFTIADTNSAGLTSTPGTASVTVNPPPPTLGNPVLNYTVAEGQTVQGLYTAILANVQDIDPNAKITLSSIGPANPSAPLMGFLYSDPTHATVTYTADGYNAVHPTDALSYTVSDAYGGTATGTINITDTGASEPTQVGAASNDSLTASSAGTRLIGGDGNDTLTVNAAKTLAFAGRGDDTINVNAAQATIYGGPGANTIKLGNTAQDTIVLQQGGTDQISGFNLHNDVLDLRQVLAEAQKSFNPADFQVTANGSNATLSYISTPSFTGGSALASLVGVGSGVTLQTLINDGALKVA